MSVLVRSPNLGDVTAITLSRALFTAEAGGAAHVAPEAVSRKHPRNKDG